MTVSADVSYKTLFRQTSFLEQIVRGIYPIRGGSGDEIWIGKWCPLRGFRVNSLFVLGVNPRLGGSD